MTPTIVPPSAARLGLRCVAPSLAWLAGRASHAWGVRQAHGDFRFRVTGRVPSFTALAVVARALIGAALVR